MRRGHELEGCRQREMNGMNGERARAQGSAKKPMKLLPGFVVIDVDRMIGKSECTRCCDPRVIDLLTSADNYFIAFIDNVFRRKKAGGYLIVKPDNCRNWLRWSKKNDQNNVNTLQNQFPSRVNGECTKFADETPGSFSHSFLLFSPDLRLFALYIRYFCIAFLSHVCNNCD